MSMYYCSECEKYRGDSKSEAETVRCRVCGGVAVKIEPGRMG